MTARARKTVETFKQYRQALKDEARWLAGRLAGKMVFLSKPLGAKRGTGTTYVCKKHGAL